MFGQIYQLIWIKFQPFAESPKLVKVNFLGAFAFAEPAKVVQKVLHTLVFALPSLNTFSRGYSKEPLKPPQSERLSEIEPSKGFASTQVLITKMGYHKSGIKVFREHVSCLGRTVFGQRTWRARGDLNPRSPAPKAGALIQTGLRAQTRNG